MFVWLAVMSEQGQLRTQLRASLQSTMEQSWTGQGRDSLAAFTHSEFCSKDYFACWTTGTSDALQ